LRSASGAYGLLGRKDVSVQYSVLLVDDSEDILRLFKRALVSEDILCDTAKDGVEAQSMLSTGAYQCIISDLRMPRMHGHKLMLEALEKAAEVPFIVITGVTDPRVINDLYLRGAADVITKPFNFKLMALRVKHLLRRGPTGVRGAGDSADPRELISRQLEGTAAILQNQLAEMTRSFESTISELDKRREDLEVGYLGSVRILANLIERVGQSKGCHAVRVEDACASIAESVNFPKEKLLQLKIAALLHEIGAFGMPDGIRHKAPWALTDEERAQYQRYPEIGATFLSELKDGKPVVELVEHHAENFDGTGFPAGKTGRQVSLGVRILRLADGCDTFLMYDDGGKRFDALQAHLMLERGRQYDPELVPVALDYFDRQLRSADVSFEVPVAEIQEGHILAENIFDKQGRFLTREGVELTPALIYRIKQLLRNRVIRVRPPAAESRAAVAEPGN